MAKVQVGAERVVGAPAEQVYRYLADYREHHPKFLPPAFSGFQLEQGGIGEGTVFRVRVTTSGRTRDFHMQVWEPQPGRTLTENDLDSSLITTFTVEPQGNGSRVRIDTVWDGAGGVGGFFERLFAPMALRRLYADELERLDQYARAQAGVGA
jgi:hypothetical protein